MYLNIGPIIENYKVFTNKTNVEFVQCIGNTSVKMRVWERGSGETFACGTGACTAYYVCNKLGLVKNEGRVYLRGGELKISIDDKTKEISMCGLATKICDGVIKENF